jgi:nitroreductase
MDAEFDLGTVDRLLSTTRAVRRRLDLARPVPRDVVLECLRLAQQAPSGTNRQGWRFVVVTDAARRARLAELYRRAFTPYLEARRAETRPGDTRRERLLASASYLAEHLGEVPVHVVPCIRARLPEKASNGAAAGIYGSIYPAVWSFQLALRSRGLGSVLTTLHLAYEREAAELLGIPDSVSQVGLIPVAYTTGGSFKPGPRASFEDFVCWESWSEPG